MTRKQQIDEIAKIIFERGVALESIDFIHGLKGSDHFTRIATAIYNAGYRNASKETEFKQRVVCGDCAIVEEMPEEITKEKPTQIWADYLKELIQREVK